MEAQKALDAVRKEAAERIVAASHRADAAENKVEQAAEEVAAATKRVEQAAEEAAAATKRAEQAAEEQAANAYELERVRATLAAKEAEEEEIKSNSYKNLNYAAEFSYYMAYGDALRAVRKSGMDVGPLLEDGEDRALEGESRVPETEGGDQIPPTDEPSQP
ncbi:hypothetical protein OROMI_028647 [Orobanche minor]